MVAPNGSPKEAARFAARRYGVLGLALATTIAAIMVLTPLARVGIAAQILISVPLVASLYTLSIRWRDTLLLAGAIAVLSLLAVLFILRGDADLLILDTALRAAVLAAITWWIGAEIAGEVSISIDTILGGICLYLLLGFLYAHLYAMLELADPGALVDGGRPLGSIDDAHPLAALPSVIYYSYATLTTVAYGDITPATSFARFVAITEAMLGQLFPAIFIARLVSLNVAQNVPKQ